MKRIFYLVGFFVLVMALTSVNPSQSDDILTQTEEEQTHTCEESNEDSTEESVIGISLTESIMAQPTEMSASSTTVPFPESGIPVLMYHSISTNPKNSLCVSEEQFKEEMEWLYTHAYHTMTVDDFCETLKNQSPVPENPVLITFDDGYADNYTVAWPILKQYGFTATFFIVTQYVNPSRIDWEQLKELTKQGNSIGSHTVSHYDLTILSQAQQKKEIGDSKRILEEKLGITVRAFCFPSGEYNETTLELLSELGYSVAFTTKYGKVHTGDNPFLLKRVRIWGGMTASQFIKQVAE